MKRLEWSREMSVGIDKLDQQHKKLFAIYNNLLVVLSNEVANRVFGLSDGVLQELAEYINVHFDFEEGLMVEAEYPEIEMHKAQHKIYVNKITEAQARLNRTSQLREWEDLCKFLSDWLVDHVMGVDRRYAPYVKLVFDKH
jgi:hemerythrin-like metal-binding protein